MLRTTSATIPAPEKTDSERLKRKDDQGDDGQIEREDNRKLNAIDHDPGHESSRPISLS